MKDISEAIMKDIMKHVHETIVAADNKSYVALNFIRKTSRLLPHELKKFG
jgi:hypothetical protein